MSAEIFNPNPTVFAPTKSRSVAAFSKANSLWLAEEETSDGDEHSEEMYDIEDIDQEEIFGNLILSFLSTSLLTAYQFHVDLIRSISDPEHRSMTLEQLAVVSAPQIIFDSPNGTSPSRRITVEFTPTVPHCGMSTFIGT